MPEREFEPMKVVIGSVNRDNAQQSVVGRDDMADQFWEELRRGSLQVLSERRMGKTWLLHLAQAREPEDFVSVFLNVEDLKNVLDFSQRLMDKVYVEVPATGKIDRLKGYVKRRAPRVEGQDVGKLKIPTFSNWKEGLQHALTTFQSRIGEGMPVLILDELPHLLDSVIQTGRHEEAIELLDTLRALRQSLPNLRMVYCGSLGFHIVFSKLHKEGYTGQPVNEMGTFDVLPLKSEAATQLAGNLLLGEDVQCTELASVASAVGEVSARVPFYIQNIVHWMWSHNEQAWSPDAVSVVLNGMFDDVGDPAKFKYYDQRLDQHYPSDWVEQARIILDILSRESDGVQIEQLLNLVRHIERTTSLTQDDLLKVLEVLREDHYVVRQDGTYRFKLEIVRKWWHTARGSIRT